MPFKRGLNEAETLALARSNGYQPNAHQEADATDVRPYAESSLSKRQHALDIYVEWHTAITQDSCRKQGLEPPQRSEVEERVLGKGCAVPTKVMVKDFVRYYCHSRTGRLDTDTGRPTVTTVQHFCQDFWIAFIARTGHPVDCYNRSELYRWVRQTLLGQGVISNRKTPKYNFNQHDLKRVLTALWTFDDATYTPERYRIQFTYLLRVYCWTGARIGAFFKGGLQWRDIDFVLRRRPEGGWKAFYQISQRYVKNNPDPENNTFGAANKENDILLYNETALLLTLAVADGVLLGIDTLDDLWAQEIGPQEMDRELMFHDWALDEYVLRACSMHGGLQDGPMSSTAFLSIFQRSLIAAGYPGHPSVHAIRREVGKHVDERYTAVQRGQHLGQADPKVFGTSYVANCSSVDGDAAFFGKEKDDSIHEYFQGLGRFREPGLPAKLPSALKRALEKDPELCRLTDQVQRLKASDPEQALRSAQAHLRTYRSKLQALKLKEHRNTWTREQRIQRVMNKGPAEIAKASVDRVMIIQHVLPQRSRIADSFMSQESTCAYDMQLVIKDLVSLCTAPSETYLPGNHPIAGHCPVSDCNQDLSVLKSNLRHSHVMKCKTRSLASERNELRSNIHYCYVCYTWVTGARSWDDHCCAHIRELSSRLCGAMTYCYTLVRPAYCPFCMGHDKHPAGKRLSSFERDSNLWRHMDEFHLHDGQWPKACPHPLCDQSVQFDFRQDLIDHFADAHAISACEISTGRQRCKRKLSLVADTPEANRPRTITFMPVENSAVQASKALRQLPPVGAPLSLKPPPLEAEVLSPPLAQAITYSAAWKPKVWDCRDGSSASSPTLVAPPSPNDGTYHVRPQDLYAGYLDKSGLFTEVDDDFDITGFLHSPGPASVCHSPVVAPSDMARVDLSEPEVNDISRHSAFASDVDHPTLESVVPHSSEASGTPASQGSNVGPKVVRLKLICRPQTSNKPQPRSRRPVIRFKCTRPDAPPLLAHTSDSKPRKRANRRRRS